MIKNFLSWKTERHNDDELKKKKESFKTFHEGQSKDGFILVAEGEYSYRYILYTIKVFRYYTIDKGFIPMSIRKTREHAVVEYPEETKKIIDLLSEISDEYNEFLFYDTLHSWNEKQSIQEQIDECHSHAKGDIDKIISGDIYKEIDKKIQTLMDRKEKLMIAVKENVRLNR
jgi:hypothetical protein